MLKLQFLTGKKHNEEWSAVKNCNFSKLQFYKCTFTVISLHIFAVYVCLFYVGICCVTVTNKVHSDDKCDNQHKECQL